MPLDENDLKKIGELIAAGVGAAIEKQAAEIPKVVAEQLKPVNAKLAEGEKAAKEAAEKAKKEAEEAARKGAENGGEPDPSKKKTGEGESPEMLKMREKLEKLEAENKRRADEQKAAEEKAKADRLENAARDALHAAGVPAERSRIAVLALKDAGMLEYNEQGEPGLKFQRKGYTEVVTGKDAAAEWLKSDAGKLFVPPSDARGTGEGGGKKPPRESGGTPVTVEELTAGLFGRALGGVSAARD